MTFAPHPRLFVARMARAALLALAVIVAGCEREERDFRIDPAAANTAHSFRMSELQPGTTRPSPVLTTTAPSTSPTTSASTAPTQPVGGPFVILPGPTSATTPSTQPSLLPITGLPPFDPTAMAEATGQLTPQPDDYGRNAHALTEGKRLYSYFNCVGCHAHGGGGMGPALMDDQWIYGYQPPQIYSTIVQGRPNGMPAFGGRIPDHQIWQIAYYVRSMSGLVQRDAAPGREDRMKHRPPEHSIEPPKAPKNAVPLPKSAEAPS